MKQKEIKKQQTTRRPKQQSKTTKTLEKKVTKFFRKKSIYIYFLFILFVLGGFYVLLRKSPQDEKITTPTIVPMVCVQLFVFFCIIIAFFLNDKGTVIYFSIVSIFFSSFAIILNFSPYLKNINPPLQNNIYFLLPIILDAVSILLMILITYQCRYKIIKKGGNAGPSICEYDINTAEHCKYKVKEDPPQHIIQEPNVDLANSNSSSTGNQRICTLHKV